MSSIPAWLKLPLTHVLVLVVAAAVGAALVTSASPARATYGVCDVADTVVSKTPGADIDPLSVNTDPTRALVYDGQFYSLGHGGSIVLGFTGDPVLDGPGEDILIAEGNAPEGAEILISFDGVTFVSLGTFTVATEIRLDIAPAGLGAIHYVKIVDDNVTGEPGVLSLEAGFDLDSVEAFNCGTQEPTPTPTSPPPTPTATPEPTATPTPPSGGEGCTPGYWKQRQHFDSWVGYSQDDLFDDVFGVSSSFGGTLLQALARGGGGENALGRHAVAALLNSATGDVGSGFTEAGVIQAVQDAYASGDFEPLKNQLAADNEAGCPLN